ncbi:MAG TPA: universal stress protein [Geobacteraceae bacterium]|nr:universal stress protein [Geobacteraceae bacterium]
MLTLKKLLVAFDGSPSSYKAFDFALEMSNLCRGASHEIFVLAVAQPPEPADIVEMDAIIDAATEHYEELFKELRQKAAAAGDIVTTEIAVGHPADQIVHYAAEKGCDMILIGQRGKSRMEQWLLGSVSKRVAAYAHCTVTIVK